MQIFSYIFLVLFFLNTQLDGKINFSSRDSRIAVSGGSLVFQNEFDVSKGTFEFLSGTFLGANIYFNDGQYRFNKKKADVDGTLLAQGTGYILAGNESIDARTGMVVNPFLVLGAGNILSGQPDLQGTSTLLNEFSELQINITNRLSQSLLMNNGTIKLLNDLILGDDVTLSGSGRVDLNNRTLRMPGKESTWASELFFDHATDIVLNAKTALSGTWTFGGANAVLQGNGNILDLTSGGTLWIKSGADVEFTDLHIKGLGEVYGSIVFEDETALIRLSNATLQLASNYTITNGGLYIEGANSSIITGTNSLMVDIGASMTVDSVTLFADALDSTPTVNIVPNIPDNQKLIYLNGGIIKAEGAGAGDTALVIATSNAVAGLLVAVSNAVVGLSQGVTDNSDAIVGWIQDTSNAVFNFVINNSQAIVAINELNLANSYAIVATNSLTVANSWAIVALQELAVATSDALLANQTLDIQTSNAVVALNILVTDNSNAIVGWVQDTSNIVDSLYGLLVEVSNAIIVNNQLSIDNSNAIVGWIKDTSDSVDNGFNQLSIDNSNAIISMSQSITDNSNAISGWIQDTSDAVSSGLSNQLSIDNSNAIVGWIQDASDTTVNAYNLAVDNSYAIGGNQLSIDNSNAIVSMSQGITDNSNAISGWIQDTSDAVSGGLSNQLSIDNSDAIVGWIQDTSNIINSLYGFVVENSNAILGQSQGITDNSNLLLALLEAIRENSNAIVTQSQNITNNSNAIVGWVQDTSNIVDSLYDFAVESSHAILSQSQGITDNSNAILAILDRIISPTTLYLLEAKPTASVIMDESLFLHQEHTIKIFGDMSIDGSGGTIYFSDPIQSQLQLQPSVRLTLRNITFANLHHNNIYIPPSSELIIEDNVTFYLANDITFSEGKITFTSNASVFKVQGHGGLKKLTFENKNTLVPIIVDLGTTSFVLQDIELTGVELFQKSSAFVSGQLVEGGIICAGRAYINIAQSNTMNFMIENLDNMFKMRNNNIALRGFVFYGSSRLNTLNIQFSLLNSISEEYRLILGDNTLYVYSEVGDSYLIFNDFLVEIFNEGSNSFVMDARSGLFGQNLFIQNFPIKLLSTQCILDQNLQIAADQPNAINASFIRSVPYNRPKLAYELRH